MLRAGIALAAVAAASSAPVSDCKNHPLLDPTCCTGQAPASFNVTFATTVNKQSFTIHIERKWSPLGVDRFYCLAKNDYFSSEVEGDNNDGFFRVVPGFVVQFGIAGNATVAQAWENAVIDNDPVILSNIRGTIAYAAVQDPVSGQATNRTTQVYINFADNSSLDPLNFTPFGVISAADMKVVDQIYAGYQQEPDQDSIYAQGDVYLRANFPKLDYITGTKVYVGEQ